MNWIKIVQMLIALWPLIQKILEGDMDEESRSEKANKVTSAIATSLAKPKPPGPVELITDIFKALW